VNRRFRHDHGLKFSNPASRGGVSKISNAQKILYLVNKTFDTLNFLCAYIRRG